MTRRRERHCTEPPLCDCVRELVEYRDRVVAAAEAKNLRIRELERLRHQFRKELSALRAEREAWRNGTEEKSFKARNGQLYAFMGRALRRLAAHDASGAAALLAEALRLSPEQLDELAFKASLEPRHGPHPNGNHLKGTNRNRSIRKRIRSSQRARIFERDLHRCRNCGRGGSEDNPLTIDHIVPIGRGGTNNDTNLQTLCAACNRLKAERDDVVPPPLDPADIIRPSWEESSREDTRDPARIERLLGALRSYWQRHPDLRLGQIVWNMAGRDPFYVEDDEVEAALAYQGGPDSCLHPGVIRGSLCPSCGRIA